MLSGGAATGSIPACAGEPYLYRHTGSVYEVYPRVCGGTMLLPYSSRLSRGLSPRVRGNLGMSELACENYRSIPACAGEPAPDSTCCNTSGIYPRVCGGTR